jgi:hypothetical protein
MHARSSSLIYLFLALCISVSCLSCNDEYPYFLTRSSAATAIEKSPNFEQKTWAEFTTGRELNWAEPGATFLLQETFVPGSQNVNILETDQMDDTVHCAQTAEERETDRKKGYIFFGCYHTWPSPEGQVFLDRLESQHLLYKYPIGLQADPKSKVFQYMVKIGDPVVTVTGITKEGNHATVEFDLTFSNLNEMGKAIFPAAQRYTQKYSQKAELDKYDDGWRVTKMGNQLWGYGPE